MSNIKLKKCFSTWWKILKTSKKSNNFFHLDGIENDFEESHNLFREAFPEGFPWEVLKVMCGPPAVIFTWRHWGKFVGSYQGNQGQGQVIEMFGMCRVTVDKNLKICKIEAFFDPDSFLCVLEGKLDAKELSSGQKLIGDISKTAIKKASCPRNKMKIWKTTP